MEKLGKICVGVLILITTSLIGGYAFMKLWQWFIVYAFSVQAITLVQAVGLAFFWGCLKPKNKDKDNDEFTWEKLTNKFIESLSWLVVTLGLGYLITLFQ